MRSLLFVPGNSAKMMAKAAASGADVIVFDLEDAVHPDSKPAARPLVAAALTNSAGVAPARYVRAAQRDLTRIIPVCTETPGRHALAAAKSWAHPRLAAGLNAYSPRSTQALRAWCRSMESCWMRRTMRRRAAS